MAYNFWTTFLDYDHTAEGARHSDRARERRKKVLAKVANNNKHLPTGPSSERN